MCADYSKAFSYMIRNEDSQLSGVVTPEPNGGKARLGINSEANPQAVIDGFYDLPLNDAIAYATMYYQKNYWMPHSFDAVKNQQVASKLFDIAVNMGNGDEHIEVAQVLAMILGHKSTDTLADLNVLDPTKFLNNLVVVLKQHYNDIYNANPARYSPRILQAWLNRAEKLPPTT
jgi:lysozyme family protein